MARVDNRSARVARGLAEGVRVRSVVPGVTAPEPHAWWADADPEDRRALATTLFERIRVLGISQVMLEPTQEARDHGLAEAFGPDEVSLVGARGDKPP